MSNAISTVISTISNLLNSVTVPGAGFTFFALFLGILAMRLSTKLIGYIFGFRLSGDTASISGGANKTPKISKERSNDEI